YSFADPDNLGGPLAGARFVSEHSAIEIAIPWRAIYPERSSGVPPWTRLGFAALIGGGGDSYVCPGALPSQLPPPRPHPPRSYTVAGVVVDRNGDGVPDAGAPYASAIAGRVDYQGGGDLATRARLTVYPSSQPYAFATVETGAGGGAYTLGGLPSGSYRVRA